MDKTKQIAFLEQVLATAKACPGMDIVVTVGQVPLEITEVDYGFIKPSWDGGALFSDPTEDTVAEHKAVIIIKAEEASW